MSAASFEKDYLIRFSHCDPAGIVYFPQYLVLTNWALEDFFNEGLKVDFAGLIERRLGIPIVKLQTEFVRASRQGEVLTLRIEVTRLGERSLTATFTGRVGDEVRLRSEQVFVMISLDKVASMPFPDDVRAALRRYLPAAEEVTA
ncbi:acyl-CoA thioesterase [Burkholderia glumae]|uniref:acyl-CoA thioesterase n=1 Tax=Burkholderia glumae TaxID=337 RepID=UPI001294926F|nr:thioesterase family protein [Burkholderia glumae]MCM2552341.1 acyl-CoA thioesterase [Burkholderia glumae]NVE24686.1 acyl-CoA thioesterase [Burkholderia glumae]QGA40772.1 acyl-CoA thioesterase [Burkholderia glumae]